MRPRACGCESVVPDLLCRIPSSLDTSLLHAIETTVIDWSHQIRDVLSQDSAQALLDGLHPLPRVEFEFWGARLGDLKCIHEQVMSLPRRDGSRSSQEGSSSHIPSARTPRLPEGPTRPAPRPPPLQRPQGLGSSSFS